MNKKKLACAIIIAIVVVLLIIFIVVKTISKKDDSSIDSNNKIEVVDENNFSLKSTKKNAIEKDGIEATEIKMQILGDQLEVKTTIKNNTKEDLNGYMIEIDLLDGNGNTVTTIAENSVDVLKSGESKEISNYVMGIEDPKQIKGAKIKDLIKSNVQNSIENTFEEITPSEDELNNGDTTEQPSPEVPVGPQQEETEDE